MNRCIPTTGTALDRRRPRRKGGAPASCWLLAAVAGLAVLLSGCGLRQCAGRQPAGADRPGGARHPVPRLRHHDDRRHPGLRHGGLVLVALPRHQHQGALRAELDLRQSRRGHLDRAGADRHRDRGPCLDLHPRARPLQAARVRRRSRWRSQVVAQDWKWLFIYPEQGIASVNELAFPSGTPLTPEDHLRHGDELLLHSGAGRPDLRHGRHADAAQPPRQRARCISSAATPSTAATASPTSISRRSR